MSTKHHSLCVLVGASFFLFGSFFILKCKPNLASEINTTQSNKASEGITFRISVEEVHIDAVVLNKNGLQIADLQKEDFEIYQDGKRREILSSIYLAGGGSTIDKPLSTKQSIPIPIFPDLTRDQVRRTIAFIVDDLAMSMEDIHYARMAMRNFVEKQMEPGDLVTILLSSYGSSSTQMFTSDRKLLLARIENVRFCNDIAKRYKNIADHRYYYFGGQLSAIQYCIRALKSMPGRKALMVLSGTTTELPKFREEFLTKAYNILADEALRAGVVVNVLNVRGLEYKGAPEFFGVGGYGVIVTHPINQPEKLNPLPQKTGGILVQNTNFFHDGIGDVNNAMKGYYLLSYTPPPSTFASSEKSIYHRLKIMSEGLYPGWILWKHT
jgi:VWFA-related protein